MFPVRKPKMAAQGVICRVLVSRTTGGVAEQAKKAARRRPDLIVLRLLRYSRGWLRCDPSRSCGRGLVQNAVVDGKERQFQPVRHADLVVHVAQVVLDDLLGSAELRGDLFVLIPLNDQGNDAQL